MQWIGWVATAAFAASYFFRDPALLRRWQAGAALLWMAYGFAIHSSPVIVANAIVASLAIGSTWFRRFQGVAAIGGLRRRAWSANSRNTEGTEVAEVTEKRNK